MLDIDRGAVDTGRDGKAFLQFDKEGNVEYSIFLEDFESKEHLANFLLIESTSKKWHYGSIKGGHKSCTLFDVEILDDMQNRNMSSKILKEYVDSGFPNWG
tara:strand:+ start:158 stop:460 length:303 start_codon:yes stop_codon:yes gene_type:complete